MPSRTLTWCSPSKRWGKADQAVRLPREYSDNVLSSQPARRAWCLGISCVSKLPSRSHDAVLELGHGASSLFGSLLPLARLHKTQNTPDC